MTSEDFESQIRCVRGPFRKCGQNSALRAIERDCRRDDNNFLAVRSFLSLKEDIQSLLEGTGSTSRARKLQNLLVDVEIGRAHV